MELGVHNSCSAVIVQILRFELSSSATAVVLRPRKGFRPGWPTVAGRSGKFYFNTFRTFLSASGFQVGTNKLEILVQIIYI